jgi:hypothetical protein
MHVYSPLRCKRTIHVVQACRETPAYHFELAQTLPANLSPTMEALRRIFTSQFNTKPHEAGGTVGGQDQSSMPTLAVSTQVGI